MATVQWNNALLYSGCSQPHTAVLEVRIFTHLAGYPHKYKLPGVAVLRQGDAFTKYSQNVVKMLCEKVVLIENMALVIFFFWCVCVFETEPCNCAALAGL